MAEEADNLVLRMLREIREKMATKGDLAGLATKDDLADVERRIRTDVASDMVLMRKELSEQIGGVRKELSEQIAGLRRAVVEYHSSVVGHGLLISDLDARVRRVEQHLNLPPLNPN